MTLIDDVRLEIGDDTEPHSFTDEQITTKLAARDGNVLLAAADLLDILATRAAGSMEFSEDGQSFKPGSTSNLYAKRAALLRARAAGDASEPSGLPTKAPAGCFPDPWPLDI